MNGVVQEAIALARHALWVLQASDKELEERFGGHFDPRLGWWRVGYAQCTLAGALNDLERALGEVQP